MTEAVSASDPIPGPAHTHDHDADYAVLLASVQSTYTRATEGAAPVFQTEPREGIDLFDVFLAHLPADRQVHTCSACRRFVTEFGGLVCIAEDGKATSALWDTSAVPAFYQPAVAAVRAEVLRGRTLSPFLARAAVWGTPQTGDWSHLALRASAAHVSHDRLRTPGQIMAEKREGFRTLARALTEFTPEMLNEALRVLEADALHRSERFVGPVRWLADLKARMGAEPNARRRDNILWRAVATAPAGFCHPRSSVAGSLLEDIAAGLPFEDVRRRFNAMVHPLQYQRPQAAPAAANIAEAERIVAQLGIARSLERRFARLDEVEAIWRPKSPVGEPRGGVFGHLTAKGTPDAVRPLDIPTTTITWEKFARTVLPGAEALQVFIGGGQEPFLALVTATHADAPPILKWDREDRRNPVSWYVYHGGSSAQQWQVQPNAWHDVTAVVPLPTTWGDRPMPFLGEGVVMVVNGAADIRNDSIALFPEQMRQELHAVRATIEAFSRRGKLSGQAEASACGIDLRKAAHQHNRMVRVRAGGRWTDYRIDRWD